MDGLSVVPTSVLRLCREELHTVLHHVYEMGYRFTDNDGERIANVINALGDGDIERAAINPIITKARELDGIPTR